MGTLPFRRDDAGVDGSSDVPATRSGSGPAWSLRHPVTRRGQVPQVFVPYVHMRLVGNDQSEQGRRRVSASDAAGAIDQDRPVFRVLVSHTPSQRQLDEDLLERALASNAKQFCSGPPIDAVSPAPASSHQDPDRTRTGACQFSYRRCIHTGHRCGPAVSPADEEPAGRQTNQPGLHPQLRCLPWKNATARRYDRGRGHGRNETRVTRILTGTGLGVDFPHLSRPPASPATAPPQPPANAPARASTP